MAYAHDQPRPGAPGAARLTNDQVRVGDKDRVRARTRGTVRVRARARDRLRVRLSARFRGRFRVRTS